MIHKKNTELRLKFPLRDSASPESFKSGVSVSVSAFYDDGAGAAALSIAGSATEIATSGVYELVLSASEMDHDQVLLKLSGSGCQDELVVIDLSVRDTDEVYDLLSAIDGKTDDIAVDAATASTVAAKLPGGGDIIGGATAQGNILTAIAAVSPTILLSPLEGSRVPGNYFQTQQKLGVFQGETKTFSLPIYQADGTTPLDLTSFGSVEFIVESSGTAVLTLTPTISGDDDNVALVVTSAVALDPGEYGWKLWGDTSVLSYGTLNVLDSSKA